MNNYPEYAKIGDKKYKINTDFRVAIECQEIATDESISDYERALAIIYKLFGDNGINDFNNYEKLLEIAIKYLSCGKELDNKSKEEPDMDFNQDKGYIESSFKYDYKYNPYSLNYLHWYEFYNDLNNLSNSEMGNCCVLNRIRNLRNYDTKEIKDPKERKKIEEAKKQVALKKEHNKREFSEKEQQNMEEFYKSIGL